jgi:uncharacterized membrane protein
MSLGYVVAGSSHFLRPEMYLSMVPPILPFPLALIYISGAAETGLGLALLHPKLRSWAAWGIVALLIAVFPANIHMYQTNGAGYGDVPRWALLARLPLQGLLILWAYSHTKKPLAS